MKLKKRTHIGQLFAEDRTMTHKNRFQQDDCPRGITHRRFIPLENNNN